MKSWKQLALGTYYLATLSERRRAAVVRAASHCEPVQVLFYHRVADTHPNDWTIGTEAFVCQMKWLLERFDIVGLGEAQQRIASGKNRWPTACITFDDGYHDNCHTAIPWLIDNDIPFTYFVSTDHVLAGKPFPHDVRAGLELRPNDLDDLKSLSAAGVEIGAHSRSHANIAGPLRDGQLEDEIAGSKHELERALGIDVRYFAFPFGMPENLSPEAFRVAWNCGYRGVCSAYGGYNFPGDDSFHLRRIHGDPEMTRFVNWLTVDPRKLRSPIHFDPGNYAQTSRELLGA